MKSKDVLKNFKLFLRGLVSFCLRKIQGTSTYKKVATSLWSGIEIKEADEEDLSKVIAWFIPGRAKPAVSRNPNTTNFVAKKGDRVIGFVQLLRHPERNHLFSGYWLFSLRVRIPYRGIGIGEELSQKVIERAREEGAEELSLLVRKHNRRAIKLFSKLGFEMKVIPTLEEKLEKERHSLGYRKVVMNKVFYPESGIAKSTNKNGRNE